MKRLLGYLRPYLGKVAVAILLLILASDVEIVGPSGKEGHPLSIWT